MSYASSSRNSRVLPISLLVMACILGACNSGPPRGLPRATALERRGEAFLEAGELKEAEAVFRQAAYGNPAPFYARLGLARSLAGLGRWDEFDVSMQAALSAMPQTPDGMELAARTFLEAAQRSRGGLKLQYAATALQYLTRVRVLAPDIPHLSYHAGVAQMESGNTSLALPLLHQAVEESPDLPQVIEAIALCYRRLRVPREVLALLEPIHREGNLTSVMQREYLWALEQGK